MSRKPIASRRTGISFRHSRRRSLRAAPRSQGLSTFARGHLHDSRNWSGAYLTPRHPERFTLVAGRWQVPDPQIPDAVSLDSAATGGDYRSSAWIGLGGKRPYNPLPQIGTSQHIHDVAGVGQKSFGAWWQWWIKDNESHHYPIPILNFDVAAGHVMVALLFVTAAGEVQFFLKNRTTGVYVSFRVSVPSDLYPLGATAEWVHERPTWTLSRQMYPLPRCTPVHFQSCLAASAHHPGEIARLYDLRSARFVRMYEVFNDPFRPAFISVAKRNVGANALDVNYRDPLSGGLFT